MQNIMQVVISKKTYDKSSDNRSQIKLYDTHVQILFHFRLQNYIKNTKNDWNAVNVDRSFIIQRF